MSRHGIRRLRLVISLAVAAAFIPVMAAIAIAGQSDLAAVRAATAKFHDQSAATAAGYGPFYVCTDEPGLGAMGQHWVKGSLVGDGKVDPLQPEAIMYEPKNGGGWNLVGVEYVVFKADWDAAHDSPPVLFGHTFGATGQPNRYGLPPFYALHAWIWKPNPAGMFSNWNERVSCRGTGD